MQPVRLTADCSMPVERRHTQIHDVQNLTDLMHKLLSGTTSIGNVEQNELLLNTMDKVTGETRNLRITY